MRGRAKAAVLAAGCVLVVGTGGPAAAGTVTDRGVWLLDEPGSPAVATDSSGLGNHGANTDVVGTGSSYQFNGTSSRVVVPDADSLDPGTADFAFGVSLTMTAPPDQGETYDVMRKGLASTRGGAFKIEIKNVRAPLEPDAWSRTPPRCSWRSSPRPTWPMASPTRSAVPGARAR